MRDLIALLAPLALATQLCSSAFAVSPGTPVSNELNVVAPGWTAEVIYEPGPLAGAHGIEVGPDGLLYIAGGDWAGVYVVDIKKDKPALLPALVDPQKISSFTDDISIDNQRNAYLTNNAANGEVFKVDTNGNISVLAILSGPNPVHYDRIANRLYVGEAFFGSGRLFELDASGFNSNPRLIFDAAAAFGPGKDINAFVSRSEDASRPDKDRMLIVPVPFAREDGGVILKIDPNTGQHTELLSTDNFHFPIAVDVGPDNKVYYLDYLSGDVYRLDIDVSSPKADVIGSVGRAGDNLSISPDGRIFATNQVSSNVFELFGIEDKNPRPLFPNGSKVWTSVMNLNGRILAANWMGIYEIKGKDLVPLDQTFGFFVNKPITWTATAGPDGHVLYTDFRSGDVIELDPDTGTRTSIGPGKSEGRPLGIHFNVETGKVYVAEWRSGEIIEYDIKDPKYRRVIAKLERPVDLVATGRELYVTEIGPAKITRIDIEKGLVTTLLTKYIGRPKGIDVDHDGKLIVVDTSLRQIYRIDPHTRDIEVLAENIVLNNQNSEYELRNPQGIETLSPIHVAEDGSILLGDFNGRIIRVRQNQNAGVE